MTDAVIFDLDGLLIDSEPIWREVEKGVFGRLGLPLTDDLCRQTMGLTVDAVVAYWHERRPWHGVSQADVEDAIVSEVIETVGREGRAMPGVAHALDLVSSLGMRSAIASSSHEAVIAAALDRLDLTGHFEVVVSAQHETFGKPDPGVYLTAACRLGADAASCVAIEDSLNGVRSARAAGMRCIAVPEAGREPDAFTDAVVVLSSLEELTAAHLGC